MDRILGAEAVIKRIRIGQHLRVEQMKETQKRSRLPVVFFAGWLLAVIRPNYRHKRIPSSQGDAWLLLAHGLEPGQLKAFHFGGKLQHSGRLKK